MDKTRGKRDKGRRDGGEGEGRVKRKSVDRYVAPRCNATGGGEITGKKWKVERRKRRRKKQGEKKEKKGERVNRFLRYYRASILNIFIRTCR